MSKKLTASKLRENICRILDEALRTGQPIEIERKGMTLKLVPPKRKIKLARLKTRDIMIGPFDEIISIDWLKEWKPE